MQFPCLITKCHQEALSKFCCFNSVLASFIDVVWYFDGFKIDLWSWQTHLMWQFFQVVLGNEAKIRILIWFAKICVHYRIFLHHRFSFTNHIIDNLVRRCLFWLSINLSITIWNGGIPVLRHNEDVTHTIDYESENLIDIISYCNICFLGWPGSCM